MDGDFYVIFGGHFEIFFRHLGNKQVFYYDSIGFLDPKNMCINTRIMLLYTSEAILNAKNTFLGGHFEILVAILKRKA